MSADIGSCSIPGGIIMKPCIQYASILLIILVCGGYAVYAETNEQSKEPVVLQIGTILENPENYIGQNVTFNGTITSQCGSGCWFILSDDSGDMYVTLRANDFVIPPSMGKKATVTGLVTKKDDVFVTGNQVTVGDKTYP